MVQQTKKASRREILSGMSAGAVAAGVGLYQPASAMTAKPNILFIMADQEQAPQYLKSLVRPNHDRLVKNGITFQHTYVSDPVCSPSRASIVTGLYPWETGVIGNVDIYQNAPALDPKFPTFGTILAKAGYKTGYFGKWHLSWLVEDPIMVPEDFNGSRRDQLQPYGFETSFIPTDSDDRPLGKRWDAEIARQASAWIRQAETNGQPWVAVVSLINPHDIPFGALYLDRAIPDYQIELPKSWNEDMSAPNVPVELHAAKTRVAPKGFPGVMGAVPQTAEDWQSYLKRYYYLLQDCDRNLGMVLDAVDDAGATKNTYVIYTADHGEMGGAHGRAQKGVMYEEAVTVPFILSNPVRFPSAQSSEALCSNIDFAPSIAALAGVTWPRPLKGIDVLKQTRDAVVSVAGTAANVPGLVKMVRTADWKLILYPSGGVQLFNMKSDPNEMQNRANDGSLKDVVAALRTRIDKELG